MYESLDSFPEVFSSLWICQESEGFDSDNPIACEFYENPLNFYGNFGFDCFHISGPTADSPPSLSSAALMSVNVSDAGKICGSFSPGDQAAAPRSLTSGQSDNSRSMLAERKKNKIKKGEGRDAKKDDRDNYRYSEGHYFKVLSSLQKKPVNSKVLFELCKVVKASAQGPLTALNRWAKRRMANAYSWLDENERTIGDEFVKECFVIAQAKFGPSV
jgi:hypothetical protein